jgi:hypothetical protein
MIISQLRGIEFKIEYNGKYHPEFPSKAVNAVSDIAHHLGYTYQDSYYMEYGEHFPGAYRE